MGHTPRGLTDCLIATVAIRNDVPILAHDRGFSGIAAASTLELVEPT